MRRLGRPPIDFVEYTERLQRSFGTAIRALPSEADYRELLEGTGFVVLRTLYTPSALAQEMYEILQFFALCMGWRTASERHFVLYPFFKLVDFVAGRRRGTGCIMIAQRTPSA
jgi:hypothetical protein